MIPEALQQEAITAWKEYGEAIRKAFRMRPGYGLELIIVQEAFATDDPEYVKSFIRYVKEQTRIVSEMKFVGES